ncbi:hypothetical protein EP837_02957 [Sphingobium sp. EP60837]|nr:hypothetical protein EP837_02957 [Sphingobium sp. EP60837]
MEIFVDDTPTLAKDALLATARGRSGLGDFGDMWFIEPMDRYLESLRSEARLTDAGAAAQREVMVKGLVSRLRLIDDLKRHPEILDEKVEVAGIILGLPRTGSTIFHRLLASTPGMTAIRWWEGQNYAPFPGEERGSPVERRAAAQVMLDGWLGVAPGLMSIHPLDIDGPDEEIIILGQMFVSTMLEGMAFVPTFADWLSGYDQSCGHRDLIVVLQYLQWQDPSRAGRKWILKSPSNLPFAEVAASAFPDAQLIMTHRDPMQVVPSYISMMASLYGMSAEVPDELVGRFWIERLDEWLRAFEGARNRIGEDRFIDIDYRQVAREPLVQAKRALARFGISDTPEAEAALTEFLAGNGREQRPAHDYSLERYGLTAEEVEARFAAYRARYLA